MDFLAPLMLVGLGGAAVPIVIHLIGRRRAPVRRFAAMDFLFGSNRRVARRLRLREILLLAVRVLACLAIPLALAKPFVSCSTSGVTVARGPQAVVLVIDNSFAMGWRRGGETLFDRARADARRVLDEVGPEADVAVLFTAEGSDAPSELNRDHLRLRDAIDGAKLSWRPADTTLALRRSAALLAASSQASRRVYLFSILAAKGFPPGEPAWPPGAGPELHVISPANTGTVPVANSAVVRASAEKESDLGPRGVKVSAEIVNFGAERIEDRGVTLRVSGPGGRAVARGLVSLDPGDRAVKTFSVPLPAESRGAELVVELDSDALSIDDRRYLRVELKRDVRVLLVDGDPSAVRHEDEVFYLETALRPGDRADSAVTLTTTTVDELPRRRLSDYDVVFLCNVPALDAARVAELAAWVDKGGGLFVSLGDNVGPEPERAWNAAMAPLLAQELRSLREAAPGVGGADKTRRGDTIGRYEKSHPIFAVFPAGGGGLVEASFWKYYLVSPQADGDRASRQILARFAGGAPALIEARRGAGRVLLWTSSLDRDWNNLPIHKGFLPFVQQAARHLARVPVEEQAADLLVGQPRELPVAAGDRRIEVTPPEGAKVIFEGDRLKGRRSVTYSPTSAPGFYRVAVVGADNISRPRPALDFVVNIDPRGSDTRKAAPSDLPGSSPSIDSPTATARAKPHHRVELWHALAAALILVLFGEAVLVRRG